MIRTGLVCFFLLVFCSPLSARVFDFKKESIAPYFRGTGGFSSVGNSGFADAKGGSTVLGSDKSTFNYSGEVGVLFHLVEQLSFRLGVELLQAQEVSELKGNNAAGTELYTLESGTFVFHPNAAVELIHSQTNSFRFFFLFRGRAGLIDS